MTNESDIRDLANNARALVERIDRLTNGTGDQLVGLSVYQKRNRRMIYALGVSLLLDIVLTILMAFGLSYLNSLTTRVDHAQQLTQTEVLCPLYKQFINSDTPKSRELAGKNGQDLDARDEAFRVIRRSYLILGCENQ